MAIEQYYGTGRRKTSKARVFLRPGKGKITINGKSFAGFFGSRPDLEEIIKGPLKLTHTLTKYDILIIVW